MFRTSNPAIKQEYFQQAASYSGSQTMTVQGAATKTAVLLSLAFLCGSFTWNMAVSGSPQRAISIGLIGALGAFVVAIITCFARHLSPITAPIYAALEGLFLGGISAVFNMEYRGIVMQAIMLTMGVLAVMLVAYKTGMIKPTRRFVTGVVAATGAICLVYVVSFILSIFGVSFPMIHSSGPIGILFSVIVVIVAALNLILDFAVIEEGEKSEAPKYMEWYGAFALMVTLVWLYLEILRLLAKLNRR